jgi:hypothetical protein
MWSPLAGRPTGGAGWPHMSETRGVLRWIAFWSLLESCHVSTVTDLHDFL